jgi:hypothetical protein
VQLRIVIVCDAHIPRLPPRSRRRRETAGPYDPDRDTSRRIIAPRTLGRGGQPPCHSKPSIEHASRQRRA